MAVRPSAWGAGRALLPKKILLETVDLRAMVRLKVLGKWKKDLFRMVQALGV
jgi:hypothetical protein